MRNSFANPLIKYYYASVSIIFMYSSVELFVKKSCSVLYHHLHNDLNPQLLPDDQKKDWIFFGKLWDKKKNEPVNQSFSRLLQDIPSYIRRRFNTTKYVLDIDIQTYADYRKIFVRDKKLRDNLIHGSFDFSLNEVEFEEVYKWRINPGKLILDYRVMPEKSLDFFILSINLLKYFTLVTFAGLHGNSKEKILNSFSIKELLIETVPYEYKIPKLLIDLLDKKLANNL